MVVLNKVDNVQHGEHAGEHRLFAVPEGGRDDT